MVPSPRSIAREGRSPSAPVMQSSTPELRPDLIALLLLGVISLLFIYSYFPGYSLFSNDGPLGRLFSNAHRMPDRFTGVWQDLNTIGVREPGAWPSITFFLQLVLGPVGYSKFYAPIALLILGLGAAYFFRQVGLSTIACLLGGLAAMLNSSFFSAACSQAAKETGYRG